jgi:hypothetical protein
MDSNEHIQIKKINENLIGQHGRLQKVTKRQALMSEELDYQRKPR